MRGHGIVTAVILGIIISAVLVLMASGAEAQTPCVPAERLVSSLIEQHDERPVATMLTSKGTRAMMFSNAEAGTWSLVEFLPDGRACMRGFGDSYEDVSPLVAGKRL